MIVLDTNLLLRYLLNDDAAQAKRAQHHDFRQELRQ
jgi:predicted nucleic-acid-binding protein